MDSRSEVVRVVYQLCSKCKDCKIIPEGWYQGTSQEEVVLTKHLVDQLRTNGSFTTATIVALGLPRRPPKGWAQALIGTKMPRHVYESALAGVGKYSNFTLKHHKQND